MSAKRATGDQVLLGSWDDKQVLEDLLYIAQKACLDQATELGTKHAISGEAVMRQLASRAADMRLKLCGGKDDS